MHGDARGEDLAHRFLQKLGYIVVARNWHAEDGSGELDLVAWDGPNSRHRGSEDSRIG